MIPAEQALLDRIYRHQPTREQVRAELRKRSDTAENQIMLLLARTYLDGARDGAAFGLASTCQEAWTDDQFPSH